MHSRVTMSCEIHGNITMTIHFRSCAANDQVFPPFRLRWKTSQQYRHQRNVCKTSFIDYAFQLWLAKYQNKKGNYKVLRTPMHSLENKHAKNHFCCFHQLHWDFRIFLNHFFMLATSSHFVKSVRVRSYSGPHFPAFGLKTERYGVSFHIQSKYGKIRTSITPNTQYD